MKRGGRKVDGYVGSKKKLTIRWKGGGSGGEK